MRRIRVDQAVVTFAGILPEVGTRAEREADAGGVPDAAREAPLDGGTDGGRGAIRGD